MLSYGDKVVAVYWLWSLLLLMCPECPASFHVCWCLCDLLVICCVQYHIQYKIKRSVRRYLGIEAEDIKSYCIIWTRYEYRGKNKGKSLSIWHTFYGLFKKKLYDRLQGGFFWLTLLPSDYHGGGSAYCNYSRYTLHYFCTFQTLLCLKQAMRKLEFWTVPEEPDKIKFFGWPTEIVLATVDPAIIFCWTSLLEKKWPLGYTIQ